MASRQTKTALGTDQIACLRRGAERFNQGLFFEAHEDWEIRWRHLPQPDQPQAQAAILVCGVFVLLAKGRLNPAERLARLAVERFAEAATAAKMHDLTPALRIPESEERLLKLLARIRLGEVDSSALLTEAHGLRAEVWPV